MRSLVRSSGVDAEGQQLLRVHVVECPQVGQLQQQFGETWRVEVVMVVAGVDGGFVDQRAKRFDEVLLQLLHGRHVLDTKPV